jgi:hypothetical protein
MEKSDKVNPAPKGIIAHPNKLKTNVEIGAKKNNTLFDCEGITVSLRINFRASLTPLIFF